MDTRVNISGAALGSGEAPYRYAEERYGTRFYGVPALDDIPVGHWAIKRSNSTWWEIVGP